MFMNAAFKSVVKDKRVTACVKIIVCICIFMWLINNLFINGMDRYINYEDRIYQNESENGISISGEGWIEQIFYAQSSELSNVMLYLNERSDSEVTIQILDDSRGILGQETVNLRDFIVRDWNRISVDCTHLKKYGQYTLLLKGEDLSGVSPAAKLQFTERYMLLGNGLEFVVDILYILIIAFALCFTVFRFENIFAVFKDSEKKRGFLYALIFLFILSYTSIRLIWHAMRLWNLKGS